MPTYVYTGDFLPSLILDVASGFDTLDTTGFPNVWGDQNTGVTFDLSGITSFIGTSIFDLQDGDNTFIGSNLGESILGGSGSDTISSGGGADTIEGGAGSDRIDAGAGDDLILIGNEGGAIDTVQGGAGTDTVRIGPNQLEGLALGVGTGVEILDLSLWFGQVNGTSGSDQFDVSGIQSYLGGSTFFLDYGADSFLGSDLAESVFGGSGNDTINSGRGHDSIEGGYGDDMLFGGRGNDTLTGGEGNDTLDGGKGDDLLILGFGGVEETVLLGGTGTDTLQHIGSDLAGLTVNAASSIEFFTIDFGFVRGTTDANVFDVSGVQSYTNLAAFDLHNGSDRFIGSSQSETVIGGQGADTLLGNGGADSLSGAEGRDILNGGGGADSLDGGFGRDTLAGGVGNDGLLGGASRDILRGQGGHDTLNGGAGNDRLTGGSGRDQFVFEFDWGNDTITDFSAHNGEDVDLSMIFDIVDFTDLITNHLQDNGGTAEIFNGTNTILLQGITVADIGVGLAYSADDFTF